MRKKKNKYKIKKNKQKNKKNKQEKIKFKLNWTMNKIYKKMGKGNFKKK